MSAILCRSDRLTSNCSYCNTKLAPRRKDGAAPKRRSKKNKKAADAEVDGADADEPVRAEGTVSTRKTYPAFLFPTTLEYDSTRPDRGFCMGETVRNVSVARSIKPHSFTPRVHRHIAACSKVQQQRRASLGFLAVAAAPCLALPRSRRSERRSLHMSRRW